MLSTVRAKRRSLRAPTAAVILGATLLITSAVVGATDSAAAAGSATSAADEARIESAGYATPDEAATAYVTALGSGDLRGATSAFAVETLVEHFDLAGWIELLGAYTANSGFPALPNTDQLNVTLNTELRRARINDGILMQYFALADADLEPFIPNRVSTEDADELLAGLEATMVSDIFTALTGATAVDIADVDAELAELLQSEAATARRSRMLAILGADELTPVALRTTITGQEGPLDVTLLFDAVRYGDSWWLYQLGGEAAILLGLSTPNSGVLVEAPG